MGRCLKTLFPLFLSEKTTIIFARKLLSSQMKMLKDWYLWYLSIQNDRYLMIFEHFFHVFGTCQYKISNFWSEIGLNENFSTFFIRSSDFLEFLPEETILFSILVKHFPILVKQFPILIKQKYFAHSFFTKYMKSGRIYVNFGEKKNFKLTFSLSQSEIYWELKASKRVNERF